MSDTERFYLELQHKLGGNVPWGTLESHHQHAFVEAINVILFICSFKDVRNDKGSQER